MLRYFTIIFILICIQWTFCYDEIYDKKIRNRRFRNQIKHQSDIDRRKRIHREYEELEINPVAKFDVASFIQNPEDEAVEDNELFGYKNTERTRAPKYYNEYGSYINLKNKDNMIQQEDPQDYLKIGADNAHELNLSPPLFKDTMNSRHLNLNALSQDEMNSGKILQARQDIAAKGELQGGLRTENGLVHSPEKKCPFKNMRIPFFSRSKSNKIKPKKNRKRKLLCINCPKKDHNKGVATTLNSYNLSGESENEYKINKRSYKERLCPACKKKFIETNDSQPDNKRRNTKRLFHNSRQFFQDINDIGNGKFRKDLPPKDIINKGNINSIRKRRQAIEDNDRQMKELQEVERKVDNTDIKMPIYQKSNSQNSN